MEIVKKRLANLLSVKSLVTITLTVVFAVLALRGTISGTEFLTIFTTCVRLGLFRGFRMQREHENDRRPCVILCFEPCFERIHIRYALRQLTHLEAHVIGHE